MAIRPVIRNIVTGKPVKPEVNVRLDRTPSRVGVLYSGVKKTSEFQQLKQAKITLTPENLGDGAVRIPYSSGKRVNLTA